MGVATIKNQNHTSYSFLLDFIDKPVCIVSRYGRVVYCNHAFSSLSGFALGQILGRRFNILLQQEYPAVLIRQLLDSVSKKQSWKGQIRITHSSSKMLSIRLKVNLIYFPGVSEEAPSLIIQAWEAQQENDDLSRNSNLLMRHTSDIVFGFSLDENDLPANIIYANIKMAELCGKTISRLMDTSFMELLDQESAGSFLRELAESEQNETFMEFTLLDAQGDKHNFKGVFISFQNGNKKNIYCLAKNVSRQRELESKISQLEKLEAVGQLAGGIAHDFNNVLAGISGLAELSMRKMDSDHKAYPTLKTIYQKANNAANIVQQLVMFSRKQRLSTRTLSLNKAIRNSRKLLQRYLGEDINLSLRLTEDLHFINADSSALDQIITNLCINARDAMPDGGELVISTENKSFPAEKATNSGLMPAGEYAVQTVLDTGTGMSSDVVRRMFEPFFTTKDIGQGTGLGLSIVFGLVKQLNGFIECESAEGEGTRFTIYFPKAAAATGENERPSFEEQPEGGSETILIAEDEADLIMFMKEVLETYGYKTLLAPNGSRALEIFQQNADEIDMVISDVVMPEMGGVELKLVVEKIKPSTRFLLISAYTNRLEPNIPFLQKPFDALLFVRTIRQILNGQYVFPE